MATVQGGERGRLTLEELIALNEEVAALVRAGVPLERGLLEVGGDVRGRLGAIARRLAERLGAGESLPEALEAEGEDIPRLYRAMVEAGLRAGRLPVALEGLATFARGLAELRRVVALAVTYPLIILVLAYGLFLGFVAALAPRFEAAFVSLRLPDVGPASTLARMGESAWLWGPILPVLVLGMLIWWGRSGRAMVLGSGRVGGMLGWIPWMGGLLANARAGLFAELLALLVENRVPFGDAVRLAAEATGDPRLRRSAEALADSNRRGESLRSSLAEARSFPPMLRWLIANGSEQGGLVVALRHAAETYRQRAYQRAEWIRLFLPIGLLLLLGGLTVFMYALALFIPLTRMLEDLTIA